MWVTTVMEGRVGGRDPLRLREELDTQVMDIREAKLN